MSISFNSGDLLSGNGINVSSVVNQIISGQSGPLTGWQSQQSTLQIQANYLTGIQTDLSNLQTTIGQLTDPSGPLAAQAAASSQSGVLTATAQSSALATTHQIVVTSLATNGIVYTDPLANGSTSLLPNGQNSGDIKLTVGGSIKDIPITQGSNDTLDTLASYINQQNLGVTASVVSDANGARLAIYSKSSGSPGTLSISNNNTSLSFNPPVGGTNAHLTVDGIPITSASNIVTGAIQGVTLNLLSSLPGSTVQLTIGSDASQARQAINDFVSAYNVLVTDTNQQYAVDPTTHKEGPLGGDFSLRSVQSSILNDVAKTITGNSAGLVNLGSLGINLQNDGTLKVDESQLSSVLGSNPSAVQSFFQNATSGFATNFHSDLANLTDATTGIISSDLAQNASQQQSLTTSINKFQDQLQAQRAQLTKVYNLLNATLEAYPQYLLQITTQLGTATTTSGNGNK